jgi:hypothetical protein
MTHISRSIRLLVGYLAVAGALPYAALKIAWLSGSSVGWTDPGLAHDSGVYAANAVTLGLEVVAVLLALAFTHGWGLRVPSWLVVPPIWVGTGLLAPIAVLTPVTALLAVGGIGPDTASAPVQPWVYQMVYAGFMVEALALLAAFVWHVRVRWPELFQTRVGDVGAGVTRGVQVAMGSAAAVLAALAGCAHLAWAFGPTAGMSAQWVAARDALTPTREVIDALFVFAGAAGLLMIVLRVRARTRLWVPLVLAWTGSGAMFSLPAITLTGRLGMLARIDAGFLPNLVDLDNIIAGLLIATVAA